MTTESSVGIRMPIGTDRRAPDKPFSNLSPVDSVAQRITAVPHEFTRPEQVAVLKRVVINMMR